MKKMSAMPASPMNSGAPNEDRDPERDERRRADRRKPGLELRDPGRGGNRDQRAPQRVPSAGRGMPREPAA